MTRNRLIQQIVARKRSKYAKKYGGDRRRNRKGVRCVKDSCVMHRNNAMGAQVMEVSPLGVGTMLRLERETWLSNDGKKSTIPLPRRLGMGCVINGQTTNGRQQMRMPPVDKRRGDMCKTCTKGETCKNEGTILFSTVQNTS